MNILVTGAKGFIGKNLVSRLGQLGDPGLRVMPVDVDTLPEELDKHILSAEVVVHLAGVNRPKDAKEYDEGNRGFTEELLEKCREGKKPGIILASSTQAALDNPYGVSKLGAEEAVKDYARKTGASCYVFRLPNVFGKWSKPNYNSVVATFCYNTSRNMPITVNNPDAMINLIHVDDVCDLLINAIKAKLPKDKDGYADVRPVYNTTVGQVADLIQRFRDDRTNLFLPLSTHGLESKLYSTYLSYLPQDRFSSGAKMNLDDRGSFTELLKTVDRGQVSVNVTRPGITKGNHWHQTKSEKFIVVKGEGVIRLRQVHDTEVIEYRVSGDKVEVVDIPAGYTHSITNTGTEDLVTIMWANECFSPDRPDTYHLEV